MNTIYDEITGHNIVKNARILFPNFSGEEQDYNQAGKRNFRLVIEKALADELEERGCNIHTRPARDETEEDQYTVKIGVYRDADVRLLSGKAMTVLDPEEYDMVDNEYRKGHVKNGEIGVEFHVSINNRVKNGSPYLRLDTIILPIGKSRLLEDYQDFEEE